MADPLTWKEHAEAAKQTLKGKHQKFPQQDASAIKVLGPKMGRLVVKNGPFSEIKSKIQIKDMLGKILERVDTVVNGFVTVSGESADASLEEARRDLNLILYEAKQAGMKKEYLLGQLHGWFMAVQTGTGGLTVDLDGRGEVLETILVSAQSALETYSSEIERGKAVVTQAVKNNHHRWVESMEQLKDSATNAQQFQLSQTEEYRTGYEMAEKELDHLKKVQKDLLAENKSLKQRMEVELQATLKLRREADTSMKLSTKKIKALEWELNRVNERMKKRESEMRTSLMSMERRRRASATESTIQTPRTPPESRRPSEVFKNNNDEEIKQLEARIKTLEKELEESMASNASLKALYAEEERKGKQFQVALAEVEKEKLKALDDAFDEASRLVNAILAPCNLFQKDEAVNAAVGKGKEKLASVSAALKERESQCQALEAANTELDRSFAALQQASAQKDRTVERLGKEINAQRAIALELKEQLSRKNDSPAVTATVDSSLQASLESTIRDQKAQILELENKNSELQLAGSTLQERIAELEKVVTEQSNSLEEQARTVEELEEELQNVSAVTREHEVVQQRRHSSRRRSSAFSRIHDERSSEQSVSEEELTEGEYSSTNDDEDSVLIEEEESDVSSGSGGEYSSTDDDEDAILTEEESDVSSGSGFSVEEERAPPVADPIFDVEVTDSPVQENDEPEKLTEGAAVTVQEKLTDDVAVTNSLVQENGEPEKLSEGVAVTVQENDDPEKLTEGVAVTNSLVQENDDPEKLTEGAAVTVQAKLTEDVAVTNSPVQENDEPEKLTEGVAVTNSLVQENDEPEKLTEGVAVTVQENDDPEKLTEGAAVTVQAKLTEDVAVTNSPVQENDEPEKLTDDVAGTNSLVQENAEPEKLTEGVAVTVQENDDPEMLTEGVAVTVQEKLTDDVAVADSLVQENGEPERDGKARNHKTSGSGDLKQKVKRKDRSKRSKSPAVENHKTSGGGDLKQKVKRKDRSKRSKSPAVENHKTSGDLKHRKKPEKEGNRRRSSALQVKDLLLKYQEDVAELEMALSIAEKRTMAFQQSNSDLKLKLQEAESAVPEVKEKEVNMLAVAQDVSELLRSFEAVGEVQTAIVKATDALFLDEIAEGSNEHADLSVDAPSLADLERYFSMRVRGGEPKEELPWMDLVCRSGELLNQWLLFQQQQQLVSEVVVNGQFDALIPEPESTPAMESRYTRSDIEIAARIAAASVGKRSSESEEAIVSGKRTASALLMGKLRAFKSALSRENAELQTALASVREELRVLKEANEGEDFQEEKEEEEEEEKEEEEEEEEEKPEKQVEPRQLSQSDLNLLNHATAESARLRVLLTGLMQSIEDQKREIPETGVSVLEGLDEAVVAVKSLLDSHEDGASRDDVAAGLLWMKPAATMKTWADIHQEKMRLFFELELEKNDLNDLISSGSAKAMEYRWLSLQWDAFRDGTIPDELVTELNVRIPLKGTEFSDSERASILENIRTELLDRYGRWWREQSELLSENHGKMVLKLQSTIEKLSNSLAESLEAESVPVETIKVVEKASVPDSCVVLQKEELESLLKAKQEMERLSNIKAAELEEMARKQQDCEERLNAKWYGVLVDTVLTPCSQESDFLSESMQKLVDELTVAHEEFDLCRAQLEGAQGEIMMLAKQVQELPSSSPKKNSPERDSPGKPASQFDPITLVTSMRKENEQIALQLLKERVLAAALHATVTRAVQLHVSSSTFLSISGTSEWLQAGQTAMDLFLTMRASPLSVQQAVASALPASSSLSTNLEAFVKQKSMHSRALHPSSIGGPTRQSAYLSGIGGFGGISGNKPGALHSRPSVPMKPEWNIAVPEMLTRDCQWLTDNCFAIHGESKRNKANQEQLKLLATQLKTAIRKLAEKDVELQQRREEAALVAEQLEPNRGELEVAQGLARREQKLRQEGCRLGMECLAAAAGLKAAQDRLSVAEAAGKPKLQRALLFRVQKRQAVFERLKQQKDVVKDQRRETTRMMMIALQRVHDVTKIVFNGTCYYSMTEAILDRRKRAMKRVMHDLAQSQRDTIDFGALPPLIGVALLRDGGTHAPPAPGEAALQSPKVVLQEARGYSPTRSLDIVSPQPVLSFGSMRPPAPPAFAVGPSSSPAASRLRPKSQLGNQKTMETRKKLGPLAPLEERAKLVREGRDSPTRPRVLKMNPGMLPGRLPSSSKLVGGSRRRILTESPLFGGERSDKFSPILIRNRSALEKVSSGPKPQKLQLTFPPEFLSSDGLPAKEGVWKYWNARVAHQGTT